MQPIQQTSTGSFNISLNQIPLQKAEALSGREQTCPMSHQDGAECLERETATKGIACQQAMLSIRLLRCHMMLLT
jgi:hypothetical protein